MALLPACGFEAPAPTPGDDPEDPYPGGAPPTDPTEPPSTARHCSTTDTALRLCLDFDDQTTIGSDGSTFNNPATCTAITRMPRSHDGVTEQAGLLSPTSRMTVAESADLDIASNLTMTMWARPMGYPKRGNAYWLLDNNRQYFAQYLPNGKFRCGIGTTTVDAEVGVQENRWYHVACTFDQSTSSLRVYVNGHLAGCRAIATPIPIDGTEGISIGSNLDAGETFSQPFVGGLDNIQVFNRTFTSSEVCGDASNSGCWASCL
ncbi:MAG: LamG domain-containing protein [Deltaproteobacteria bacterium]|nr:LamG domain-containing protein [Deltaproteobacteria bacterium]